MPQAGAPHWCHEIDAEGIAWLCFDRQGASTNSLSRATMEALEAALRSIEAARPRGLVLWSAKPNGFVAGADIKEFVGLRDAGQAYELIRGGQLVIERLAKLPFPTCAAIHGFALGGGLELALACTYRVCADDGKVTLGLPEVQLGIHPGFGGTVRAPQLIGARAALDLMLTGRSLRADKALAMGLVDRVVPAAELRGAAAALVRARPAPRRAPLVDRLLALRPARGFVAAQTERQVARRARRAHYPAPYAIVDLWRRHGARGEAAYEAEARSIAELFCTPTSRSLVRVFLLQDQLKALGGRNAPQFRKVHVVGAGVMGGDIAAWCAHRGLEVTLQDRAPEYVQPALDRAREFFARRARKPEDAAAAQARLRADVEGAGVADADVVIEAIFENVEAKQALYASLLPKMKPDAVLATNTSSLVLETLAARLPDPARLVGLHFFNPVSKMPLVEVVHSGDTQQPAVQAALAFARRLDKLPLPCASAPGFVVNRILFPYMIEAMLAAREGVPLAVIDETALAFGMPQGPIELADTVGLDVAYHVGQVLAKAFGGPAPDALEPQLQAKKLGRKTGEGFYRWVDGRPRKPDTGGAKAPADLEDRLILPMLNEAVAVLRERLVTDPDLLDAGVIFGTGFAPFRGGPLHYARTRGVAAIVERLRELERLHGRRFRPDPGWSALAP
ncbi:MAG: 3-hydroxyacyl-CoA dehydrogenase NAD-binding domain-containing protein [Steroidobacteraceae bacterium]|nr:3-hydroxyacyl-CoA dehydrogenase NAD-binding domain-containing protein [Steroidobacteraceae bacterium]